LVLFGEVCEELAKGVSGTVGWLIDFVAGVIEVGALGTIEVH
jgi:hypothetical protein